jgi:putative peptidoglycan lipid II flippase
MWVNLVLTFAVQILLYRVLTTGIGSWHGIGVDGIPIADSVFYLCISVVLAVLLRKKIGGYDARGVASTYVRMAIASAIGAGIAWGIAQLLATALGGGVGGALTQIATGGIVGLLVAFGLGRLFGVAEVSMATQLVTRVVRRAGGRS